MHRETRLVHAGRDPERDSGAVNPPVYRASTIVYSTLAAFEARLERVFAAIARDRTGALLVPGDILLFTERQRVAEDW